MLLAIISLICIVVILFFVFANLEKSRKDKSILNYYIKPGLVGGTLGVIAIIFRAVLSLALSILFTKGASFKKIVTDAADIKVISTVLIAGVLIGIFVAVALQKE